MEGKTAARGDHSLRAPNIQKISQKTPRGLGFSSRMGGSLRDDPNNGCEGDYDFHRSLLYWDFT